MADLSDQGVDHSKQGADLSRSIRRRQVQIQVYGRLKAGEIVAWP